MVTDTKPVTLSCIMPCHNGAPYIAEALTSVTQQTRAPDEIILVDDGSTDGSADIARSLNIDALKIISQENLGPGAARNAGLAIARGDVISFFDADDIAPQERFAHLLTPLQNDPEIDATFGHWQNFWIDALVHEADAPGAQTLRGIQTTLFLSGSAIRRTAFDRFGIFETPREPNSSGKISDVDANSHVQWLINARRAGMRHTRVAELVTWRRIHYSNISRKKTQDGLFDFVRTLRNQRKPRASD